MNEINPNYDEFKPIIEEKIPFGASETSVYCDENPEAPVEIVKIENAITDSELTNGEQNIERILIESKIKLENIDFEEDSSTMAGDNLKDLCVEEKKTNIFIKLEPELCGINNSNFHDIQTLTNTDEDEMSCDENKSVHYVKDEAITMDENYLEEYEAAESEL